MFKGAFTALVTPFRDGKVDHERLRQNVDFQIAGGIDGLVPVGTTGESPTVDFPEHEKILATVIEFARGRVPVICGVGGNATSEALHLHQFAKRAGATAGLSVNPYYNKPSQEGLYRHFMTLADACDLPIVLYNIPGRTGITMSAATVARLRKHPNIVAIKEATGSLDMASEIMSACDIPVLSGDDSLTVPLMAIGAAGVISVASNIIPDKIKSITAAALAGNFAAAAKVHHALFPFIRTLFLDGNPVGIKCALQLAKLDTGDLRLPLVPTNDGVRDQIRAQLQRLGVIG